MSAMVDMRGSAGRLGPMLGLALLAGCAMGEMPCRVGADCESGVCLVGGECMPRVADAGTPPAVDAFVPMRDAFVVPDVDGGAPGDASVPTEDGGAMGCGNGDGTITRDEVPLPVGEAIARRVAFDVAIDTHGAERADGSRLWDFEGPFAGDEDRADVRRAIEGEWFADAFPGATYTLPLSAEQDLLGVFELTADALLLRGVVSPEDGSFRTELEYEPPARVWSLPFAEGASWTSTSTVTGVASGVFGVYSERWDVAVDAHGQLGTPAGVRDVLRVNTLLTRTVGGIPTATRRHSFVEECAGTIGQVFAVDGDGADEPTMASELWRIAP